MMDYYQELGIGPLASPDEIRHAYRHVARLLHPDHCRDEQSRRLAELQMRRLNGLLRVLTNPADRENYDRSLLSVLPQPCGTPRKLRRTAPRWVWPLLGAVLVVGAFCSLRLAPRPLPATIGKQEAIPAPAAPAVKPKPTRMRLQAVRVKTSRAAQAEKEGVPVDRPSAQAGTPDHGGSAPSPVTANLVTAEPPPAPPAPTQGGEPPAQTLPSPSSGSMAGRWLFVATRETTSAGLYPPEYIELQVIEAAGAFRGRYRARYHVADKAISPTVAFEFEGRGTDREARLPWTGPGGARGDLRMLLLENGALEVTWEASRLGAELGLISGTATLVRVQD